MEWANTPSSYYAKKSIGFLFSPLLQIFPYLIESSRKNFKNGSFMFLKAIFEKAKKKENILAVLDFIFSCKVNVIVIDRS